MDVFVEIQKRTKEKSELTKFKNWIGFTKVKIGETTLGGIYFTRFFEICSKATKPLDDFHYWMENKTPFDLVEYIDGFYPEDQRFSAITQALTQDEHHNKPITVDDPEPPVFNPILGNGTNARSLQRRQFSKILTFIRLTQKRRSKDGCTIIYIPTTSPENHRIWGSTENVSNAIEDMKSIGLIRCEDPSYRFKAFVDSENRSRTYRYYVDNERKFLDYCRENNITRYDPDSEEIEISPKEIKVFDEVVGLPDPSEVRFSSHCCIAKPSGISKPKFERYLRKCLYENYPFFLETLRDIKKINRDFYEDYPEFELRLKPSFEWGNKTKTKDTTNCVVGIGIRITNAFCNKEKEERKEIIKNYGFDVQHDVKSSVPRLTLSLNKGHWIWESTDIYKLISEELDPQIEFTEERREAIKSLHMRGYFDESKGDDFGKHIWNEMTHHGMDKEDVYKEVDKLRAVVKKVEGGKLYGNEIFYVESIVYFMVLKTILYEKKQLVWLVYDCFYGKGYKSQKVFDIAISGCINGMFDVFYKAWKKKGK